MSIKRIALGLRRQAASRFRQHLAVVPISWTLATKGFAFTGHAEISRSRVR